MLRGIKPKRGTAKIMWRDTAGMVFDELHVSNCDVSVECLEEGKKYWVHLSRGAGDYMIDMHLYFTLDSHNTLHVTPIDQGLLDT